MLIGVPSHVTSASKSSALDLIAFMELMATRRRKTTRNPLSRFWHGSTSRGGPTKMLTILDFEPRPRPFSVSPCLRGEDSLHPPHHLAQFNYLDPRRAFRPVMYPAHNNVAPLRIMLMLQEIPAEQFKFNLLSLPLFRRYLA